MCSVAEELKGESRGGSRAARLSLCAPTILPAQGFAFPHSQ